VPEKLSAYLTEAYVEERAAHRDRAKLEPVMSKVPDRKPIEGDEL